MNQETKILMLYFNLKLSKYLQLELTYRYNSFYTVPTIIDEKSNVLWNCSYVTCDKTNAYTTNYCS